METREESHCVEMIKKGGLFFIDPNDARSYQTALIKNIMSPMTILEGIAKAGGWGEPVYGATDFKPVDGFLCSVSVRGKVVMVTWRDISPKFPQVLAAAAFLSFLGFAVDYNFYLHTVPDGSRCVASVKLTEDKKLVKTLMDKAFPKLTDEERVNNCQSVVKYSFRLYKAERNKSEDTILAMVNRSKRKFPNSSGNKNVSESSNKFVADDEKSQRVEIWKEVKEPRVVQNLQTSPNPKRSNLKNSLIDESPISERITFNENNREVRSAMNQSIEVRSAMNQSIINVDLDESRAILKGIEERAEKRLSCYISYTKQSIAYIEHVVNTFHKLVSVD